MCLVLSVSGCVYVLWGGMYCGSDCEVCVRYYG